MNDGHPIALVAYANRRLRDANARITELEAREQEYKRELDLKDARIRELQDQLYRTHPPQGRVHSMAVARDLMRPRPTSPETAA